MSSGPRYASSASSKAPARGTAVTARRGAMTRRAIGAACAAAARPADVAPPSAFAAPAAVHPANAAPLRPRRDRLAHTPLSSDRVDAEAPAGADDESTAARRAAAARARGARADLREVRPGHLDAAGSSVSAARLRAREAPGPGAAV